MEEGSKGGGRKGVVEGVGMRKGGMEVENGGENEGRRDEERQGGKEGARAKPGNQLVYYSCMRV